jgi:TolB protein
VVSRRLSSILIVAAVALPLALAPAPAGATFPGPNGRIAFSDYMTGQIYAVDPDGRGLRQLTHIGRNGAADFPSWSPNGEHILFSSFRFGAAGENTRIWIMNADGTHQRRVAHDVEGFRDYTPKFMPHAAHIVFSRCQPDDGVCAIWKMRSNGTHKRALTPYVHSVHNEAVDFSPSVAPNGRRIAFTRFFASGRAARIFIMRPDGSNPHPVTPPRLEAGAPDWAPGGHRIVFNSNAPRAGSSLFAMRPDGTHIHRLTPDSFPHSDALPSYSPRGDRIAFISDRRYPDACCTDLFTVDSGGGRGQKIQLGRSGTGVLWPAWGTAPRLRTGPARAVSSPSAPERGRRDGLSRPPWFPLGG